MKLIISQDGIKREIEGSFDICLSKDDATSLVRKLQAFEPAYGWLKIFSDFKDHGGENTRPLKWKDR